MLALTASAGAARPAPAQPAAAKPVFALDPLSRELKIRPRKLEFRDLKITDLRWKRWGHRVARARGISRILDCTPSCADGTVQTTATTVKLSRIREKGGKRRYTCMSWHDDEKIANVPDHGSLDPFNFKRCKAPRAASAAARCRGIDLGFTTAKVTARRMGCRKARFVVLEWKRKTKGDGPAPPHVRALGFDCHFGGTDLLLTLRCTKGEKLAKATWGG